MLPTPASTPRPRPPPIRTDIRLEIEPDDQWKDNLRKRIEYGLRNMVEDARMVRNTILNSHPPESNRERALQEYEKSMTAIRELAQEEFTRQLRLEISERKWALNVVNSSSPEVTRQQQWILDNIQKGGGPRPSSSLSPQNAPLTPPYGSSSRSPDSRINAPLRQRQPPNSQPAQDDKKDTYGSYGHPSSWNGSQLYVTGGAPRRPSFGSQAPSWNPHPRPPEPSGISRTANVQIYSASTVPFPRPGSVNTAGLTSSSAGLHRAGSLNSNLYRSSSVAPHTPTTAKRPPTQSCDHIAANIPPHGRQISVPASPHDRPNPQSHSVISPRAIPGARSPPLNESMRFPMSASLSSRATYGPQRSPEDVRRGIAIPPRPTTFDEGPQGGPWDSGFHSYHSNEFNTHQRHNSKGDSRLSPVDDDYSEDSDDIVGKLDDYQSMHSAGSLRGAHNMQGKYFEQTTLRKEAEARQAEASAKIPVQEVAVQTEEVEVKKREAGAQTQEAKTQRKEEARWKGQVLRKEEAQRREEEAQRREEEFLLEDDARNWEIKIVIRQKAEDARRIEEEYERKKQKIEQKEAELRKLEAELSRREEAARQPQKEVARQAEERARLSTEEARQGEKAVNAEEDSHFTEKFTHQALESENAATQQGGQTEGQGRKGSEGQAKGQDGKALEEQRRMGLEEQQEQRHLDEQQRLEEENKREEERLRRGREEQICLDEELELGRQEQESRRLEAEANRRRDERQRAVEKERFDRLKEQRRKAAEQIRQRAEQHRQQQQQQELRQRAKEEQEREFQRREALYYQRAVERERKKSIVASHPQTVHGPSPTAGYARCVSCISSTLTP